MSDEKTTKTRVFYYDGKKVADDPGPEFSNDEVKKHLAQYFPELAQATWDEKEQDDGTVEVTFAKRAGTKG